LVGAAGRKEKLKEGKKKGRSVGQQFIVSGDFVLVGRGKKRAPHQNRRGGGVLGEGGGYVAGRGGGEGTRSF